MKNIQLQKWFVYYWNVDECLEFWEKILAKREESVEAAKKLKKIKKFVRKGFEQLNLE